MNERSPEIRFRALRQFNAHPKMAELARSRSAIGGSTLRYFASDSLVDRLVRALGARHALPIKEVVESFEFFERVRSDVRSPRIVDLASGHGLTGALFAVFERDVDEVLLVDRRRPDNHRPVCDALDEVAPWAVPKLRYLEEDVRHVALPGGPCSVIAVHACGSRTDLCLQRATDIRAAVAVMPCCHIEPRDAPPGMVAALGIEAVVDTERTTRLRAAGYRVRWTAVPPSITPMNRIIIGIPP